MENNKLAEKDFIEQYILKQISDLQNAGFHYFSFLLIGQAIEVMGAFLDNKPFRARQQSQIRFANAINQLFDSPYQRINNNNWLYDKLRNHMAHMLIPSDYLLLVSKSETTAKHLARIDRKLVLVAEDFYIDLQKACNRLLEKIEKGEVKSKPIASNLFEFGKK
jgi:hypothetical protein